MFYARRTCALQSFLFSAKILMVTLLNFKIYVAGENTNVYVMGTHEHLLMQHELSDINVRSNSGYREFRLCK